MSSLKIVKFPSILNGLKNLTILNLSKSPIKDNNLLELAGKIIIFFEISLKFPRL